MLQQGEVPIANSYLKSYAHAGVREVRIVTWGFHSDCLALAHTDLKYSQDMAIQTGICSVTLC